MDEREVIYFQLGTQLTPRPLVPATSPPEPAYESPIAGPSVVPILHRYVQTSWFCSGKSPKNNVQLVTGTES